VHTAPRAEEDFPRTLTGFPPLLYIAAAGVAVGANALLPLRLLPPSLFFRIGVGFFAVSAILVVPSFWQFIKNRTTVRANRPANRLITAGPYKISRNPLYLVMALIVAGIACATDNVWMLAVLPPLVWIVQTRIIYPEEAYLERRFGDEYLEYRDSVRRWI